MVTWLWWVLGFVAVVVVMRLLRWASQRRMLVQHADWRSVRVRWWWSNERIRREVIRSFEPREPRFGIVDLTHLIRRYTRRPFEVETPEYMLAVVRPLDARHLQDIESAVERARASEEMRNRAPVVFSLRVGLPRAGP